MDNMGFHKMLYLTEKSDHDSIFYVVIPHTQKFINNFPFRKTREREREEKSSKVKKNAFSSLLYIFERERQRDRVYDKSMHVNIKTRCLSLRKRIKLCCK